MSYGYLNIAATPSVRAVQTAMGSDRIYQGFSEEPASDTLTENEGAFIAQRDSFYMATVSETGWPYIQHRGGPRGFLKIVDERTLAFADYHAAVDWAERELATYPRLVAAATTAGLDGLAWRLAETLWHAWPPSASGGD